MKPDVLKTQVGGDHYKKLEVQPFQLEETAEDLQEMQRFIRAASLCDFDGEHYEKFNRFIRAIDSAVLIIERVKQQICEEAEREL